MRTSDVPTRPALSPLPRLAAATLPVAAAALVGSAGMRAQAPGWYAGLVKPAFNPPDWAFPVAWSILYGLIAVALWRLLGARPRTGPSVRGWRLALAAFAGQLVLNAAWTPTFFAAREIGLALVVVGALLALVLWTVRLTWRFDRAAAWLLAPYAAWVAYATLLNAALLHLN